MWTKIAHFILKARLPLLVVLGAITVVMGILGSQARMTFKFAELIPKSHQEMKYFTSFRETFGEDANTLVIGFRDSNIYEIETFKRYNTLCQDINSIEGIEKSGVIALPTIPYLNGQGSSSSRFFEVTTLYDTSFWGAPVTDSLKHLHQEKLALAGQLGVFKNSVFNPKTGATVLVIPLIPEYMNSKRRQGIVNHIQKSVEDFVAENKLEEAHFAGLPYVRTVMAGKVKKELNMFLVASLFITALVLFFFFRSFSAVIYPLLVIGVSVIWTVGTIVIFGYEMSLLTGLIPPIIVVIGIPNCVYLLSKYHQEYAIHHNKIKALSRVIRKIGVVTLITNCTTAIGFLVLIAADITILKEFGYIAGINVFSTFIVSIILIPIVFSYLPDPKQKHLKHLDFKGVKGILDWINNIVHNHRSKIFALSIILVIVSAWGSWKVYGVSYLVDDIPESSKVKKDLRFFESNFSGVMPLEIVINTKNPKAYKDLDLLRKVNEFSEFVASQEACAVPNSILTGIKAVNQSLWNDSPDFYALPTDRGKGKLARYIKKSEKKLQEKKSGLRLQDSRLMDSTGLIRLSVKVADIGSIKMDSLINQVLVPKADEIFGAKKAYAAYKDYKDAPYRITGTTLLFIKGNKYLIQNLRESLLYAIFMIACIMGALFRNVRMVLISLIPNIIPLLLTGALMGYLGIALKPSTALIFSIAFGISVDDSIHYLAKFRQELFSNGFDVKKAVTTSIYETGSSMIYTSIVLFFGFIIFTASNFLGTKMLGLLTSTTLLFAMVTNLVLLPSLLLTFDSGKRNIYKKRFIDKYIKSQQDSEEDAIMDKELQELSDKERKKSNE